jgi:RsiW-degrading membrane proteinase PrsW (M82 family)
VYIGAAIGAIALGIILSQVTSKHFGHDHHHRGDSAIDVIPVAVLLFANIAHPAIDGFSAVETFRVGGVFAGVLYATSIVFHELLRQSAFVAALAPLRINWRLVVSTAIIGLTTGVVTAVLEAHFFDRYQVLADIATLFSYSFVIAEFYTMQKNITHLNKWHKLFFIIGGGVGVCILLLSQV